MLGAIVKPNIDKENSIPLNTKVFKGMNVKIVGEEGKKLDSFTICSKWKDCTILPNKTSENWVNGFDLFSVNSVILNPAEKIWVSTGVTLTLPESVFGRQSKAVGFQSRCIRRYHF